MLSLKQIHLYALAVSESLKEIENQDRLIYAKREQCALYVDDLFKVLKHI